MCHNRKEIVEIFNRMAAASLVAAEKTKNIRVRQDLLAGYRTWKEATRLFITLTQESEP
jgi:hypothetical protein